MKTKSLAPINQYKDDTREEELIRLLASEKSWHQAALKAGYSEGYANQIRAKKLASERFRTRLINAYKGNSLSLLPIIGKIDENVVEKCLNDTDEVVKFDKVLKRILQNAGALAGDQAPMQPTIAIKEVRNLQINQYSTDEIPRLPAT